MPPFQFHEPGDETPTYGGSGSGGAPDPASGGATGGTTTTAPAGPGSPRGGIFGHGAAGGHGGSDTSGSDPIQTVADAFLAALGSGVQPSVDTSPYVISSPDSGTGGSMNWKTILVVAVLAAAAWFAWKKWGKSAVSGE